MSFLASTTGWDQFVNLVAFAGFVVQAVIWHRIRREVNCVLPPSQRMRWWRNAWEAGKTYSLHKQFFPISRLRSALNIIMVAWVPFGVVGYFRLHHAIDAWRGR